VTTLYIALLIAGILMLGAEIYLPGGILGVVGAVALVAAIVVGFRIGPAFGWAGVWVAVLTTALGLWLWVRFFPRTRIGRRLTLSADGRDFKARSEDLGRLVGHSGVATTDLRPAGIALIDGRRVDVVTDGEWVETGRPIRVVRVEGIRVVVVPADPAV